MNHPTATPDDTIPADLTRAVQWSSLHACAEGIELVAPHWRHQFRVEHANMMPIADGRLLIWWGRPGAARPDYFVVLEGPPR